MKPGRKSRIAAKTADLSEKLNENFLCKVFCLCLAACHSQRKAVCATVISLVDNFKRSQIALCRKATKLDVRRVNIDSGRRLNRHDLNGRGLKQRNISSFFKAKG